ncbi:MAG: thioredoxin domain-containing protein [Desulfosudis oleivorans]|nr:thioredoxin domain-containing protein [Desulfosudis oleivorans]
MKLFNDKKTADFLNEHFISIKVDREECPDIDETYMTACQGLSFSCGLAFERFFSTPDKKPLFAGTYYPKKDEFNRPAFLKILQEVQLSWTAERDEVESYFR